MEDGKDRWKLEIYQEDSIPLLLNLINIPQQIVDLERTLFPRMCIHFKQDFVEKRYRDCTRLILSNLLLATQRKKHLYYSRSPHSYKQEFVCRENRNFATFRKITFVIDQLEKLELIDQPIKKTLKNFSKKFPLKELFRFIFEGFKSIFKKNKLLLFIKLY